MKHLENGSRKIKYFLRIRYLNNNGTEAYSCATVEFPEFLWGCHFLQKRTSQIASRLGAEWLGLGLIRTIRGNAGRRSFLYQIGSILRKTNCSLGKETSKPEAQDRKAFLLVHTNERERSVSWENGDFGIEE
jgi:hypothetical protein